MLDLFAVTSDRRAPCIAVLGPDGCGHHEFVTELRRLTARKIMPPHHHLTVDLAKLRFGDQDSMYSQVVDQILADARTAGVGHDIRVAQAGARLGFISTLEALVSRVDGWCILYLENMDEVPRFFARSLNRQLRACREREAQVPNLGRLGFVVTGALSLFELKVEADSAFQHFHVVALPEHGLDGTRAAVRRYLRQRDVTPHACPELDVLGDVTGGEPMFLDALANELGLANLLCASEELLRSTADRLAEADDSSVLREVSLDLFVDEDLRERMAELAKRGWIAPANPLVDIDRVQLLGLVVRDGTRQRPAFRFRNRIIERFLRGKKPHLHCADARSLSRIQGQLGAATDSGAMAELLQGAWGLTTRDERSAAAQIELAMQFASDELHWVGGEDLPDEPEARRRHAARRTGRGALERGRPFLLGNDRHLMVGVPLRSEEVRGVVVVSVTREFCGRFSEHGLRHWIGFLRLVERSLLRIALAELGRHALRVGLNSVRGKGGAGVVERRSEPPGELVLVPLHGAVLIRAGQRTSYRGSIDKDDIEDANQRCRKLGTTSEGKDAEKELSGISLQFGKALSGIENLQTRLVSADRHPLVITTDAAGLMLPLELLHDKTTRSAMCLQVPVSRRLLDKPLPVAEARGSFARLMRSLVVKRHALRALILVSDPGGDLEHVGEEAEDIARLIRSWCDAQGIPASVTIVGPNQCDDQEVEQVMSSIGHIHLMHLCGHGHDVPEGGAFLLRERNGGTTVVSHKRLTLWSRKTTPWLTYMSTCHGATIAASSLSTRYTSVLDALTSAGIPYAVAFRSAVSDLRAKQFANSFYKYLFEEPGSLSPMHAMLRARQDADAAGSLAWAFSLLVTQEQ